MMMVFDLLRLGGQDVRHDPLRIRRERVERVLDGAPGVLLPIRRLADDGLKAWQEVLEHNYEGLGGEGPGVPLRGRPVAAVAQTEAAELPRGRAGVLQTVGRSVVAPT
jgi:hypothetical protein